MEIFSFQAIVACLEKNVLSYQEDRHVWKERWKYLQVGDQQLPIIIPLEWEKSLKVQLPCSKRHWKIPRAVKGSKSVSRFTLGVREVEYKNDDSEASWLIYITIWQHLRREGSSKRTGSWPTGKEISIKDLEGIILLSSPWFWVIVS